MAIYRLRSSNNTLEKVERTTFKSEKIREREDLQALLRQQIETIAPDCLVISEEFSEWQNSKRRIDLLAVDKNGNLVVIELKRDETGAHSELQAIRYAAMVSAMTFGEAVDALRNYMEKDSHKNISGEHADDKLRMFLGAEFSEDDFGQNVRIVLVSSDFSKEVTTSVMWLNQSNIDIVCIRMIPYKHEKELFIDIQQIIPLPEIEDYQVRLRNKSNEQRKIRERNPQFEEIVSKFGQLNTGLGIFRPSQPRYRQIRAEDWPSTVHYEFLHYHSGSIGLEFHIEAAKFVHLADIIKKYEGQSIDGHLIKWATKGKGCIQILVSLNMDAAEVAGIMEKFIKLTKDDVELALNR